MISSKVSRILALVLAIYMLNAGTVLAEEKPAKVEGPKGKPVILRVGPGFNPVEAKDLSAILSAEGCPTTVTTERGFPKRVTVEVDGGKGYRFKESGSAGAAALDACLGKEGVDSKSGAEK